MGNIKKWLYGQWLVALAVALLLFAISQKVQVFYSALAGGLVAVVPNLYFARQCFRYRGALAASRIVRCFYRGEVGKVLLTTLLFGVIFALGRVNVPALFLTYLLTLFSVSFMALFGSFLGLRA